jgi:hypothetical protein
MTIPYMYFLNSPYCNQSIPKLSEYRLQMSTFDLLSNKHKMVAMVMKYEYCNNVIGSHKQIFVIVVVEFSNNQMYRLYFNTLVLFRYYQILG